MEINGLKIGLLASLTVIPPAIMALRKNQVLTLINFYLSLILGSYILKFCYFIKGQNIEISFFSDWELIETKTAIYWVGCVVLSLIIFELSPAFLKKITQKHFVSIWNYYNSTERTRNIFVKGLEFGRKIRDYTTSKEPKIKDKNINDYIDYKMKSWFVILYCNIVAIIIITSSGLNFLLPIFITLFLIVATFVYTLIFINIVYDGNNQKVSQKG